MESYNEITNKKITQQIKWAQNHVPLQFQKMIEDIKEGRDFIIKLGEGLTTKFEHGNGILMNTPGNQFVLHPNATNQLAGKYGISVRELKKYMNGSFGGEQGWQDDVVAYLLNQHSQHAQQERFLVRTVRNEARAILSDSYKILDSEIILTQFLETAMQQGAVFFGGDYTGLRIYLEMINPTPIQIETENNGTIDIVFGTHIRTSDYGAGALELRSFIKNAVCLNGMIGTSILHQRHLGEKLPEGFEFAKETIIANSNRSKLIVRDMTKQLLDENSVRKTLLEIQNASRFKIDIKKELEKLSELGLYKTEVEETEVVLLNNRKEDGMEGENTLWKLSQAVSAVARNSEPDRKRELEEIASNMIPKVREAVLFEN